MIGAIQNCTQAWEKHKGQSYTLERMDNKCVINAGNDILMVTLTMEFSFYLLMRMHTQENKCVQRACMYQYLLSKVTADPKQERLRSSIDMNM